ncbi:MAG: magnesium-protoporphyrin IX monomethyl ester anaerobic oxidative cyclase [Campylobacterota bacterium]|nr:magnesium-protoporphyrin IX monomethyl ester anaerobic oxidative cyclase [Campylobacterota bacterium]
MKTLIINPPHQAIGSRIPVEHLPPLGLLYIGGSLLDEGYEVELLDADYDNQSLDEIMAYLQNYQPDCVLMGHSGSTSAHPIIMEITQAIKAYNKDIITIYGGVFPSYHFVEIFKYENSIDYIVRGEGEEIIKNLFSALHQGGDLAQVEGVVYKENGALVITPTPKPIKNLDAYRVGWELINLAKYSYWGEKRAVVMQFSRGCPHQCNYCGQRLFWQKWRHRDPKKFASEIAWLHREHGVEVINLADENPTSSKRVWAELLEAIIAQDIEITIVGSTRADDIVRDKDILHLYKQAGITRFLLGIETYDESQLAKIKKGSSIANDRLAIVLLREHQILSMATYVFGFGDERGRDYIQGAKQIIAYDPDQIQLLYATPHKWTPYFNDVKGKRIVEYDLRKWDYKHQVMETKLAPWRLFFYVKLIEIMVQLRPIALYRLIFYPDKKIRDSIKWYYRVGRKVWFYEIYHFVFKNSIVKNGKELSELWR